MNWIERIVVWTLVLAIGTAIFTITACQVPLKTQVGVFTSAIE